MYTKEILKRVTEKVHELDSVENIEFFFVAVDTSTESQQVYLVCSKFGGTFLDCNISIEEFKSHCYSERINPRDAKEIITTGKNIDPQFCNRLKSEKQGNAHHGKSLRSAKKKESRDHQELNGKAWVKFSNGQINLKNNLQGKNEIEGKCLKDECSDHQQQSEGGKNFNGKKLLPKKETKISYRRAKRVSYTEVAVNKLNDSGSSNQFDCYECFQSFSSLIELESHLKINHHAELHYRCTVCKRRFRTELRYKLHIHKVKKHVFKNSAQVSNEQTISQKEKDETQPKVVSSIEVPVMTSDGTSIDNSTNEYSVDGTVCRICFIQFDSIEERGFHEENEHNALAKNEITRNSVTGDEAILGTTMKINSAITVDRVVAVKKHQCKICLKRFLSGVDLRRHSYLHAGSTKSVLTGIASTGEDGTLKCSECSLLFTNPIYLQNHRYSHFQTAKFQCPECPRHFKRRCHLTEHRNVHQDARPYSCTKCGRSFKLESCLRSHSMVHSSDTPHQCSECGKQFKRAASLRQHSFTHGDRIYPCAHCDKKFAVPHNLRVHIATIHEAASAGESHNRCDKCGKSFKRARNLTLHLRSHDPNSMIPCPLCPKRYTRSADLKLHLVSHGDRRPFVCDSCHQAFKTPSNLKRHKLIHCRYRSAAVDPAKPDFQAINVFECHPLDQADTSGLPQASQSQLEGYPHQQWQELQPLQLQLNNHQTLTPPQHFLLTFQQPMFQEPQDDLLTCIPQQMIHNC